MNSVLAATGLGYRVAGRDLVTGASLDLSAGGFTVIIGPNGAGKSTLLKLLTGELSAHEGSVHYGATPIARLPAWRLACRRAVMAQGARLAFPFTVYEMVRLGIDGVGRAMDRLALHRLVADMLAAADITHLAARSYQTLSGGEQQRVQFARVLCQMRAGRSVEQQQVLFLDEPVASLDLCHQFDLLDTARDLAATGVAVLAVLHDINLAIAYADHLIVMKAGRIFAQGAPAEIVTGTLLAEVFDLALTVEQKDGIPFILPQNRHRDRRTGHTRQSA